MRSRPRQLRRSSINTGRRSSFEGHSSQLQKFSCAQVWRVVAATATATCIFGFSLGLSLGYGLDFLLGMLTLESDTLP
jgi:hypothetical protein